VGEKWVVGPFREWWWWERVIMIQERPNFLLKKIGETKIVFSFIFSQKNEIKRYRRNNRIFG
jgi:hypothetical protein